MSYRDMIAKNPNGPRLQYTGHHALGKLEAKDTTDDEHDLSDETFTPVNDSIAESPTAARSRGAERGARKRR